MIGRRRAYAKIASVSHLNWVQKLGSIARGLYDATEGTNLWRLEDSGELTLLRRLASIGGLKVTWDVGANIGDWSEAAVATGSTRVHAFEVVPSTARELEQRFAGNELVHVHPFGLSDATASVSVSLPAAASPKASVRESAGLAMDARVRAGDEVYEELGGGTIDYLKVDTEGHDHRVLQGLQATLASGAVRALQFEYGPWALESRFLLKDFYDFLEERGFVVGKLKAQGVHFGPYTTRLEDFRGLNFAAARREDRDLVRAMAGAFR